jgi:amidase
MTTSDLCFASASTLARAIRRREVTAEEVILAHLNRIAKLNPVLNSVIQIAPESAVEQARAADAALGRGEGAGPLHGVPFTVKDVYEVCETARLVTAPGIVQRPEPPPERDSTVVRRLRAAGAILIAVTKATLWSDCEERYGFTHNPYDLTRTPSGSSGGEAATIAAGGSPLGLGSDSGGSLRLPAHCCGVATLRPSNGRVPRGSDAAGTNDPRTAAGPLARAVEDVALALRIIRGFD